MWHRLKRYWSELKRAKPGERFTRLYERNRQSRSKASRWLFPLVACVCLAVGVVLVFIPGPAILFFVLAAGLIATQSRWLARRLDHAELGLRGLWHSLHHRSG